jgi:hypothetical protein
MWWKLVPKYFILNIEAAGSFRILVPACVSHIQEDSNLYINYCEPRMCGGRLLLCIILLCVVICGAAVPCCGRTTDSCDIKL